jgi:hypothetical protein
MMKTDSGKKADTSRGQLTMRSIFRCMMEEGYYPTFEKTHIIFGMEENMAVLEYEEGVLSMKLFFEIDEDAYDLFLEASNETMFKTFMVKPVLLDDMNTIMFSFEVPCGTIRELRKMLRIGIEHLGKTLETHRNEMKKLILAEEMATATLPATDDLTSMAGRGTKAKMLS